MTTTQDVETYDRGRGVYLDFCRGQLNAGKTVSVVSSQWSGDSFEGEKLTLWL